MSVEFLRVQLAANPIGVDAKNRVIRGYVIAQRGPFETGRGEFDDGSLRRLVSLSSSDPRGWPCNYGHHADKGTPEALDAYLGRVKNVRLDNDKVRGDLHLDDTAFMSASGGASRGDYLLARAKSDPASFGSSLSLTADKSYKLDGKGRRAVDENGEPLAPTWMPTAVMSSDVVARGDACPDGFMSASLSRDESDDALRFRWQRRKVATAISDLAASVRLFKAAHGPK